MPSTPSASERLAEDTSTAHGVGGMITKLQAAKLATAGGADVAIANGHENNVLERLAQGEALGTWFPATTGQMESRKRWMLSGPPIPRPQTNSYRLYEPNTGTGWGSRRRHTPPYPHRHWVGVGIQAYESQRKRAGYVCGRGSRAYYSGEIGLVKELPMSKLVSFDQRPEMFGR